MGELALLAFYALPMIHIAHGKALPSIETYVCYIKCSQLRAGLYIRRRYIILDIYGCFLNWYLQNTPNWSFLVGKPIVVGYHHFRKPPYNSETHISVASSLSRAMPFGMKTILAITTVRS